MWAALAPALVQGGLSMLSGILGGKSAAKQARLQSIENDKVAIRNAQVLDQQNQAKYRIAEKLRKTPVTVHQVTSGSTHSASNVDYEGMMKAAEASGINPITFIRNGGLAAFARSNTYATTDDKTTTKGQYAGLAAQIAVPNVYQSTPNQVAPQKSVGESVVGGISDGFRTYMDQANRQNTQDFQRELLQTQLDAIQRSPQGGSGRSFFVPGFSTSGSTITPKGTGGLMLAPTKTEVGDRTSTNPYTTTSNWKVDRDNPDAEQAETRYGDIAQELFGVKNFVDDVMVNLTGKTKDQRYADTKNMWDRFIGGLSSFRADPTGPLRDGW